jgi:hypothetical protein
MGGLVGEVWAFARELSAEEIRDDYLAKRNRYKPALPVEPVHLREMNAHFAAGLWKEKPTKANWPAQRERILAAISKIVGSPDSTGAGRDGALRRPSISQVGCISWTGAARRPTRAPQVSAFTSSLQFPHPRRIVTQWTAPPNRTMISFGRSTAPSSETLTT